MLGHGLGGCERLAQFLERLVQLLATLEELLHAAHEITLAGHSLRAAVTEARALIADSQSLEATIARTRGELERSIEHTRSGLDRTVRHWIYLAGAVAAGLMLLGFALVLLLRITRPRLASGSATPTLAPPAPPAGS